MFLIASHPPLFLHLMVIPDSALSTASIQIIGEYCVLGGIELSGVDPWWHSPCTRGSSVSPRLGWIRPCAAAANARDAIVGKTTGKGGFKAFPENSAQVLRGQRRGDGNRLRSAQERADSLRGACIFESVYNAINSVYP